MSLVVYVLLGGTSTDALAIPQGVTGLVLEAPDNSGLEGQLGPVLSLFSYEIERELNRVGTFSVNIAMNDPAFKLIGRGWKISIVQEDNQPSVTCPYLMYRGHVLRRRKIISPAGSVVLRLEGTLRSQEFVNLSTHKGLAYAAKTPEFILEDLFNEDVTVPAGDAGITITTNFNDISNYSAALKVAELARYNLRETFEFDKMEAVKMDDVPDSGFVIQQAEYADPGLENVHNMGIALLSGTPTISHKGDDVINRITGVGSDTVTGVDDPPLTLASANNPNANYAIRSALNPNGSTYYYLQDDDSVAKYGLVEHFVQRTDIKNPSDNATTRRKAANVLYALLAGTLLARKSEFVEIEAPVANGHHIWALPGSRMGFLYTGTLKSNISTLDDIEWEHINRDMLIVKRRDSGTPGGVRQVTFTLAMQEIAIRLPGLPNAIVIPPPPDYSPTPSNAGDGGNEPDGGDTSTGDPIPDCCPDPTTDTNDSNGPDGEGNPPPDTEPDPDAEDPPPQPQTTRIYFPERVFSVTIVRTISFTGAPTVFPSVGHVAARIGTFTQHDRTTTETVGQGEVWLISGTDVTYGVANSPFFNDVEFVSWPTGVDYIDVTFDSASEGNLLTTTPAEGPPFNASVSTPNADGFTVTTLFSAEYTFVTVSFGITFNGVVYGSLRTGLTQVGPLVSYRAGLSFHYIANTAGTDFGNGYSLQSITQKGYQNI